MSLQQNIKTLILKALKITNSISKENKASQKGLQFLFTTSFGFIQGDIDEEYSDSFIRTDGLLDLNFALNLSKEKLKEDIKLMKDINPHIFDGCFCLKNVTLYPNKDLKNKIKTDSYLLFTDMIIGVHMVQYDWVSNYE